MLLHLLPKVLVTYFILLISSKVTFPCTLKIRTQRWHKPGSLLERWWRILGCLITWNFEWQVVAVTSVGPEIWKQNEERTQFTAPTWGAGQLAVEAVSRVPYLGTLICYFFVQPGELSGDAFFVHPKFLWQLRWNLGWIPKKLSVHRLWSGRGRCMMHFKPQC